MLWQIVLLAIMLNSFISSFEKFLNEFEGFFPPCLYSITALWE